MTEFTVTWTIDLTADSALEAAQKAHDIQRDPESTATVFKVAERRWGPLPAVLIDLTELHHVNEAGDRRTEAASP